MFLVYIRIKLENNKNKSDSQLGFRGGVLTNLVKSQH